MIIKLNKKFPGIFKFEINKDEGFTDRLECLIRFNYKHRRKIKDIYIHSKKAGQGEPSDNWSNFLERAREALFNYQLLVGK